MTRRPSPRLGAYLLLGVAGLFAGAALGRPEPVILLAPLLLAALVALALVEDPELSIDVALEQDRLLEGSDAELTIRLVSPRPVRWLELAIGLPPGLVAEHGSRNNSSVLGLRLDPGVQRQLSVGISPQRWGLYRLDQVAVRMRDRFGFFAFETEMDPGLALRVFPQPEGLRRVIRPAATQASAGNEVSRRLGEGIEFAGVRPHVPGDEIRRVNWRISSRRSELHVNEQHPERSTDVVILLDTFTDVLGASGQSSLATAVRAANGIADHYLRRRDRVGLIAFGGSIRWLVPAMGLGQSYRIVDTLIGAQAAASFVWKGVDLIPPRSLPAKALVIALTPLVDVRTIEALLDLRGRGFDLAVVEVSPEALLVPPRDDLDQTIRRLWAMQRELLRDRFRQVGVPVAVWSSGASLEAALEEVRAFRRHGRPALA
jgi:uncharacterized protein (DUF58 family)